ncbi:nucleotidyltransferase family protein [Algoriphagus halophytocola]|uniref:Nucleotidyltransferase family protein n=1 Tax=Algoriphagus halophytocola TaxID=2991499 RepID=A0ABY6MJ72_9BACT|nr:MULTISPECIES: nucleotidyltransferase family protein [unclassified Algoriphagus]UZD23843.1 nucleotidyltransferase family protein [Algoriphagus sp. TR-M5]WBL41212.1 nucleotidyltransferase family protein [Algoriphagus sp. TR-M9]
MKTGIIILAAGESTRLGYPKQIAQYKGKTLLQLAIDAANGANAEKRVVVLGANRDEIKKTFSGASIPNIPNPNFQKGMSSSIKIGLEYMLKFDKPDQVIIMLCDQPFVDSKLLNKLIEAQKESEKGIVSCKYSKTFGVPILFGKAYLKELMQLSGDEGAKKLALAHEDDMEYVSFPKGKVDIDTEEDLRDLNL